MQSKLKKIFAFLLCFLLCIEQSGFAQIAGQLDISGHLAGLGNALAPDVFRPLHLRYLSYNPLENNFQLFLDKGSLKNPSPQELQDTTKTLLNYFFVGITLPNDTFWVNLRPDAEDNIIDDRLAQTDVGKIMLETDLQLKKDTAKFTSPETPEGRKYWDKLYAKAEELYGREQVTIPTLTRPWIVPDEIIIRETSNKSVNGLASERVNELTRTPANPHTGTPPSAYIYKATLKVMLEQDYLNNSTNPINPTNAINSSFKDERSKALNEYSTQLIRELIIPKLTKEVNSSKRYASLRQVYYSLILAQWFKARYSGKDGLLSHLINRQDLTNLAAKESWSKTTYFKAYQKSFKDGEYNIQEPLYTPAGQVVRSYFSGGISGIAPTIPNFGEMHIDPKTGTASSSIVSRSPANLNSKIVIGVKIDGSGEVKIEEASSSVTQQPKSASSAMESKAEPSPTHARITIDNKNINFILDEKISEILKNSGIDLEDLLNEAIKKASVNPSLSNIAFRLRRLSGQSTIWVHNHGFDRLVTFISADLLKQLLFIEIWKAINYKKTIAERLFRRSSELRVDFAEYLINELTPNQIINLWIGFSKAQVPYSSFELTDVFDKIRQNREFRFSKEQMSRFRKFYEENQGEMDVSSKDSTIGCLTLLIYTAGLSSELRGELDSLSKERDRLWKIQQQINEIEKTTISYDISNPPFLELISAYEKILKLDPYSKETRERLHYWRERLGKQQEETRRRESAQSLAQSFHNAPVNGLFNAVMDAIAKEEFYAATELLKVLSEREAVSLLEVNLALSLLAKAVADYKDAHQLFNKFIALYRHLLIQEALSGFHFTSQQQKALERIYLIIFGGAAIERNTAISRDPALQGIDSDTITTLENRFENLKFLTASITLLLNRYLAETNSESRNPIDILQFLRFPAEGPLSRRLSQVLEEAVAVSSQDRLNLAIHYFLVTYDINLRIPFAEETSFVDIPESFGLGTKATLYSKNEIEELLSQLILLDRFLSTLPFESVVLSLTLQKILIVKNIRASWSHSEAVKHNMITLALGELHWRGALFHEFGHSLHGPDGNFSAYIDPIRLRDIILKHRAFFETINPSIVQMATSLDIEKTDTGVLLWEAFQAIYKFRLQEWEVFNKRIGVEDLNEPFKMRNEKVEEEYTSRFGITTEQTDTKPSLSPEYMFEKSLMDVTEDEALVRDNPPELVAEYVQLYILFPESLRRLDPIAYEFITAILGSIHSSSPSQDTTTPNNLNKASSAIEVQKHSASSAMGGIDFRSLPIVTQAVTNLSANISSSVIHNLISINLDEEWSQIERMASSGITPSSERIKEYVRTTCAQNNIIQDRDKILLCISDILRQEEESCVSTDPVLKDILVLLESGISKAELKAIFTGIKS